ncbi:phosphoadenylylsulfate reductase (thioredoxin) [Rhodovulum imhoffii]|uniref:Adenosine 5'-phosphosulfate reductase n=1 Tax=Rhodovulum imhoffii TaxID=365340 RepID=A0A2T5BW10_9RHOB|nr:phosphoadenylyl-sulfate reductase [Rhodovulum imhoffii]MBK5933543.1 phosphoadenosine phosphosulfate reductase [Rhodovulum imhoffii]PTN03825.1 phosphoadenylylsulfate reductase (thioredoxin) [Rhodovulum imhoffii]
MTTYWPPGGSDDVIRQLRKRHLPDLEHVDVAGLLRNPALGRRAVVSSFGAESAVLLHYISRIAADIPVLFLDTGRHFKETLIYRDQLVMELGLDLHVVRPDPRLIAEEDANATLWSRDPNMCCALRKTFPLQDALEGYDTWISGRKRYQAETRSALPLIERDGTHLKINPMALWTREDIVAYFERHVLPRHPLEALGYLSIGCAPCTRPVTGGEDLRAGRWAGTPEKTECGIHLGPDGHFVRSGR